MAHRIAGLDLSLAGTAAVVLDSDGRPAGLFSYTSTQRDLALVRPGLELHRATHVRTGDAVGDYQRTTEVADTLRAWLRRQLSTGAVVGIEDHAYGAQGRAIYQLGHLHGIVRRDVVGLGCRFLLLGVGEVKQAATGRGNAEKALVVQAAAAALDLEGLSRGTQEALADAYAVARLTWHVDRARRNVAGAPLPRDLLPLFSPPKGRPGLADRPLIG